MSDALNFSMKRAKTDVKRAILTIKKMQLNPELDGNIQNLADAAISWMISLKNALDIETRQDDRK